MDNLDSFTFPDDVSNYCTYAKRLLSAICVVLLCLLVGALTTSNFAVIARTENYRFKYFILHKINEVLSVCNMQEQDAYNIGSLAPYALLI